MEGEKALHRKEATCVRMSCRKSEMETGTNYAGL